MPEEQKPQEPAQNGQQPDYAGYPNLDELVKGYRNSGAEAKRLRDELNQAKAEVQQVRAPIPQQRTAFDQLTDYGVPPDLLREAIRMEARQEVQQAFAPIVGGMQGRNKMVSEYSDYIKFENDVTNYVQSDPGLTETYQTIFNARDERGNPKPNAPAAAMDWAFLKFGESRRRSHTATQDNGAADKAAAQIPSARSGDTRSTPTQDQGLKEAWDHFQKTGDPKPYASLRLRKAYSDEFLNR